MASEVDPDIETLRRGYELYNEEQFDALYDLFAPDVVVHRDGGQPPLHGREEVRAFMEPDAFEYQRFDEIELVRNGDKILASLRVHAKGAGSEIELDMRGWHVWTIRDGLASEMLATFDEKKARAEAGLV